MDRYVLVVCHDRDLGAEIESRLLEGLGDGGNAVLVDLVRNEADATLRLGARKYDLLLTEAEVAADRSKPLSPGERRGLALARLAPPRGIPAIVLATSAAGDLLDAVQDLAHCYLVTLGEDGWDRRLVRRCAEVLQIQAPQPGPAQAAAAPELREGKVEIVVDFVAGHWAYKLQGSGCDYPLGILQIDPKVMRKVQEVSEALARPIAGWEDNLREVGRWLKQQIFDNNSVFNAQFHTLVARVGGAEHVKIEFVVPETAYAVALEAVLQVDSEDYWMVHAPVYRRLPKETPNPLFGTDREPRRPLHCLIIEADVHGAVSYEGEQLILEQLTNVTTEASYLYGHLRENQASYNIARLEHIRKPAPGQSFLETITAATKDETWDIVHYAGHSYYHPTHGGLVFLPGAATEVVKVALFGLRLRRPRFVYLSSCQSSHASFVFKLAENNVGALVGFRWDIDDDRAFEFAKAFYDALFGMRSLEYAFLEARKEMRAMREKSPIWAAPILMM